MSTRCSRTRPLVALLAATVLGLLAGPLGGPGRVVAGAAVPAPAPWLSAGPLAGPVGTVVSLQGNAGPNCSASSYPTLNFVQGVTGNGPAEFFNVSVAPTGGWSASFVIPPFVGGAYSRGNFGADVTPGPWEFEGPLCSGQVGPAVIATFDVTGTASAQPPSRFAGMAATTDGRGYWLAQTGGGVDSYGDAPFLGSLPSRGVSPRAPVSGIAASPDGRGYWLVGQDGGVYAFGDARFYGSLPERGVDPLAVIVAIAPTPDGHGYWLLGADGGIFAFGDARFLGSLQYFYAVTALLASPDGAGYLDVPATGRAPLRTGDASVPADFAVPDMAALMAGGALTPSGQGLWEVGTDGSVFAYGDAGYDGSLPGRHLVPAAPIVGMARSPDGRGYWLVAADGGVFGFGDAGYFGSAGGSGLPWAGGADQAGGPTS